MEIKLNDKLFLVINEGLFPNQYRYDIYEYGKIVGAFMLDTIIKDINQLEVFTIDYLRFIWRL